MDIETHIVIPIRNPGGPARALDGSTLLIANGFRHRVGHIAEGCSGRKETGGPLVPGPWAYTFELCSVIDNHGGSAAETTEARAAGTVLDISDGDLISVEGHVYRVVFNPRGRCGEWIELVAA